MQVVVLVPRALRRFAGEQARVTIDASDGCGLRDVLDALARVHPGVAARVLDEQGRLRRHVNVFVGDEESRVLGGLDAPVPDGAEIAILPAVSGGCPMCR